jgi:DNA repair photolyase
VGVGRARRFVASTVLAHWRTRAVAYRIGLDDGGTLTAGADHRLLTERGWVFVAPSSPGSTARSTRPFLTAGDRLVGPGAHGSLPAPGMPVPPDARRTVLTVRQLDGAPRPMFDITTATGDYLAAGVVSHNCFARNTHTYLDLDAGLDFDSRIVVKVNAVELLRRELARPSWRGGHIAMGTNVDCYQRAEGRYQLMPGIIGALTAAGNPFSILTKGTLMLRDLDLLMAAAERTSVSLAVSVGLTDTDLWRLVEPGTPAPHRRLAMCAALREAGLRCGVLMAPILPFLSDSPSQLRATVAAIARAGASSVTPLVLHLRPGAREWFFGWLGEHHPGLLTRYQALYGSGSYAPSWYTERVAGMVLDLAAEYRIGTGAASTARGVRGGGGRGGRLDEMPSQDADDAGGRGPHGAAEPDPAVVADAAADQLTLL